MSEQAVQASLLPPWVRLTHEEKAFWAFANGIIDDEAPAAPPQFGPFSDNLSQFLAAYYSAGAERSFIDEIYAAELKARRIQTSPDWLESGAIKPVQIVLATSGQLHEDGKQTLKVSDLRDFLRPHGKTVSSMTALVRYLSKKPGQVEILSEDGGKNSLTFRLTPEGVRVSRQLRNLPPTG